MQAHECMPWCHVMHTQYTAQIIACMQDLQRKEGGGDSKAEELVDGTATKAGASPIESCKSCFSCNVQNLAQPLPPANF